MFKAHAPPLGACDDMICALNRLANLQEECGGGVLRHFIEVENSKALVSVTNCWISTVW